MAAKLAPLIARARAEYPGIELSDDAFVAYLERVRPLAELQSLDALHAGDLLLAAGCVAKSDVALEIFEKKLVPELRAALRTVDPSPSFGDEILQKLREKLLVGEEPRITSYAGTGPLGGWLRVAALREAISQRRSGWREVPVEDGLAAVPHGGRSPEQDIAHRQHAEVFQRALRAAVAARPSRDRALLRYYYSDGVGVEELGRIYRVHASTVSRWLAQARDAILADTRKQLAAALAQSEAHVDSLLGLTHSLEVSLDTLLRSS